MGKKFAVWMIVLALGSAALVVYLAKQQWDWLYVYENFEQSRRSSRLSRNGYSLKSAVDKEIRTLERSFEGLAGSREQLAEQLDERLRGWPQATRWPSLLGTVYLVSADDLEDSLRAERFDAGQQTFVPVPWATEFEPLRIRVAELLEGPTDLPARRVTGFEVVTSLPALLTRTHLQPEDEPDTLQRAWLALHLDRGFIRDSWLPELLEMFFPPPNFAEVKAAVIETASGELLFSTLPVNSFEEFGRSDASYGLVDAGTDGMDLPRAALNRGREAFPNSRRPPTEADHAWFRDLYATYFTSGHWQLHLQRGGESVADEVLAASRRSLLISIGALALIGLAIGLIVTLARSAQKLARRQMRFLLGVTHELRTPLAVLSAAGDNLADALVDDPQQLQEYGQVIQDESLRLRGMVENALHLARQDATTTPVVLRPLDIVRLTESTLERMGRLLRRAEFEVETDIATGPLRVDGDAGALQSALLNLISNALKYGRAARWLRVTLQVDPGADGEEVRITVEDRGPGIAAGEQRHLFEAFFRGDQALDEQIEGSGLGLTLVRDVARAHNGRVAVDSSPGRGSRFTLHLPLLEPE